MKSVLIALRITIGIYLLDYRFPKYTYKPLGVGPEGIRVSTKENVGGV